MTSAGIEPKRNARSRLPVSRDAFIFALKINVYGIGLMALWNTVNTLTLPDLVEKTVRDSLHGTALGLLSLFGIGLAALVQPIAGRISDFSGLSDRRRPYIVIGTLLALPALLILGWAPTFIVLVAAYMLLQIATNLAQAAFQALIPDLVKEDERGFASGVKNALSVAGAATGLLGTRILQSQGAGPVLVVGWLGLVLVVTMALTVSWVPKVPPLDEEERAGGLRAALDLKELLASFERTFRRHRTFRLAVIAQFCFLLGTYPAQRFVLLFLRDRFGGDAESKASLGMAGAIVFAAGAAVLAGALSESMGRESVIGIAIVLGAIGMIGVGFSPSLLLVALTGSLVAAGVGAFQAVNWALLSDDMPDGEEASAYGLSNLATAGSSALAGLFGPLVDLLRGTIPGGTYQITFGLAGLIAATALIPLRSIGRSARSTDQ